LIRHKTYNPPTERINSATYPSYLRTGDGMIQRAMGDPYYAPTVAIAFNNVPATGLADTILDTFLVEARLESGAINYYQNTGSATIAISSGAGTLSGTLTKPFVNGVATFNDIQTDTGGTISLVASSSGLDDIISSDILIVAEQWYDFNASDFAFDEMTYNATNDRLYNTRSSTGWSSSCRSNFYLEDGNIFELSLNQQSGVWMGETWNTSDARQCRYFGVQAVVTYRIFELGTRIGDFSIININEEITLKFTEYPKYYKNRTELKYTSLKASQPNSYGGFAVYDNGGYCYNPIYYK